MQVRRFLLALDYVFPRSVFPRSVPLLESEAVLLFSRWGIVTDSWFHMAQDNNTGTRVRAPRGGGRGGPLRGAARGPRVRRRGAAGATAQPRLAGRRSRRSSRGRSSRPPRSSSSARRSRRGGAAPASAAAQAKKHAKFMAKEGKELAAEQSSGGGMNDLVLAIRKRQARPPAPLARCGAGARPPDRASWTSSRPSTRSRPRSAPARRRSRK